MIESFNLNMIPEMPKTEGEPVIEKPEGKPEVVLLPEGRERIIAELEEFKKAERDWTPESGKSRTANLWNPKADRDVNFNELPNSDLGLAEKILRGDFGDDFEKFEKDFDKYRKSVTELPKGRSDFMAFLANRLQGVSIKKQLEKMRTEMAKEKGE